MQDNYKINVKLTLKDIKEFSFANSYKSKFKKINFLGRVDFAFYVMVRYSYYI